MIISFNNLFMLSLFTDYVFIGLGTPPASGRPTMNFSADSRRRRAVDANPRATNLRVPDRYS